MMTLISQAFAPGGAIPVKYTQEGVDISPPLAWSDVPPGTQSFALIVDDPDPPERGGTKPPSWVHWIVVDLPPTIRDLPEGVNRLPAGQMGLNDWNNASWDGPQSPASKHRYRFRLYALDRMLGLEKPTRAALEMAMKDHVLDEAQLIGTYRTARPSWTPHPR